MSIFNVYILIISGELYSAVRAKHDLHFGVYYSWYEWFNPLYLRDKSYSWGSQYYVNVSLLTTNEYLDFKISTLINNQI